MQYYTEYSVAIAGINSGIEIQSRRKIVGRAEVKPYPTQLFHPSHLNLQSMMRAQGNKFAEEPCINNIHARCFRGRLSLRTSFSSPADDNIMIASSEIVSS